MRMRLGLWMAACALATGVVYLATRNQPGSAQTSSVTLIYVGAKNCAPCETWQRTDGSAFRNSARFSRLRYREVESPSLLDVLKDENWPDDLSDYRRAIDQRDGVPLWLIVADGHVVFQSSGLSQWRQAVLPKLTQLLQ